MSKGLTINVPTRTPLADKGANGYDARFKRDDLGVIRVDARFFYY
jgi:hypothetical protein